MYKFIHIHTHTHTQYSSYKTIMNRRISKINIIVHKFAPFMLPSSWYAMYVGLNFWGFPNFSGSFFYFIFHIKGISFWIIQYPIIIFVLSSYNPLDFAIFAGFMPCKSVENFPLTKSVRFSGVLSFFYFKVCAFKETEEWYWFLC